MASLLRTALCPSMAILLAACGSETGGGAGGGSGGADATGGSTAGSGGSAAGGMPGASGSGGEPSGGIGGTGASGGEPFGAYPAGPYDDAVGATFPDLKLEGYVNDSGWAPAGEAPFRAYSMDDVRRSGKSHALVHLSAFT